MDSGVVLEALSIAVSAGVPTLLWGSPGTGKTSAVVDCTSANHVHGTACEWCLVAFDGVDACGYQNGCWDVAGVASAFTALGTDEVYAGCEGAWDVLRVTDHLCIILRVT